MSYPSHNRQWSSSNPSLLVIMLDQSGSMSEPFGTQQKKDTAAQAVNRVINEIGRACQKGTIISDRCFVVICGYSGSSVDIIVSGWISELWEDPTDTVMVTRKVLDGAGGLIDLTETMRIWVEPKADSTTPMDRAYKEVSELTERWIGEHPDCFPPIILNVTDGEPDDESATEAAARELMDLATTDGNVLLFNTHISDSTGEEIQLPRSPEGLRDPFARFLFRISSQTPESLFEGARMNGFSPQPGARCLVYNASPETMIKLLNFGSSKLLLSNGER